jgi:hypothetical protein
MYVLVAPERNERFESYSVFENFICVAQSLVNIKTKLNSVAFSLQANYTDQATAALLAKLVPTFTDRGCRVVSATDLCGR